MTLHRPLSSALQSAYKEMEHPAYNPKPGSEAHTAAMTLKRTFELNRERFGEDHALAYWESCRDSLMGLYIRDQHHLQELAKSHALEQLERERQREMQLLEERKQHELVRELQKDRGGIEL